MHASPRGGNDGHALILMLNDPLCSPEAGRHRRRLRRRRILAHLLLGRTHEDASVWGLGKQRLGPASKRATSTRAL